MRAPCYHLEVISVPNVLKTEIFFSCQPDVDFLQALCINSQLSRTRAIPEVMEHFSAWSAARSFPDKLLAISQPLMSSFCLGFRLLSIIITEHWQVQTFVSFYWGNCDSALDAVVFNEQVLRLGFFCMVWFCWMFYPLQRHKCKFGRGLKYKCALDIILHLKIVESVYSPLNIPHFLFFPLQVFHDVAYKAKDRNDIIAGIDEFLDQVTVLPPGEWDPSIRIEPPKNVPSQVCKSLVTLVLFFFSFRDDMCLCLELGLRRTM